MTEVVMDSSAVLAHLHAEPGAEVVAAALPNSLISAVNFAEVVTKLIDRGHTVDQARYVADRIRCTVVEADQTLATEAGVLRAVTRPIGASLGDRFCLALARALGAQVLTADRRWAELDIGVEVRLIR